MEARTFVELSIFDLFNDVLRSSGYILLKDIMLSE
jgi:hypothetical protein